MRRNLKFIFLAPLLFAAICDPIDDECYIEDPDPFVVNVENIASTYAPNEIIWLNAQTTAMLEDFCTETEGPELIEGRDFFLDGLFVLRLTAGSDLNSEVVMDAVVNYDIGEAFSFGVCTDGIYVLPELSTDNLFYKYSIGISVNEPGDYCVVNAKFSNFNFDLENNSAIFAAYNTLDNKIKFENCGDIYTRDGTEGYYFFSIQ